MRYVSAVERKLKLVVGAGNEEWQVHQASWQWRNASEEWQVKLPDIAGPRHSYRGNSVQAELADHKSL